MQRQAKRQLRYLHEGAPVPEWILKFITENIHTEEECLDVKTARACLETWSADKNSGARRFSGKTCRR